MDIEIKKAEKPQDLKNISLLADEIWHEYFPSVISVSQIDYMVEKFQSYDALLSQTSQGYEYYGIYKNDRLIGFTGIHPEENSLFLSKLYLHRSERCKGYARLALEFLKDYCCKNGLLRIWLTVNKHNTPTIDKYIKMGFVNDGSLVSDIGGGFVMDDYKMTLDISPDVLIYRALQARENAYAPYSEFKVGAALLSADGKIFTGCNVENASYSAGVCAERTAFLKAVSEGVRSFEAIAIAGNTDLCYPCGICRQVMSEFCDENFKIYLKDGSHITKHTLSELLPHSFTL